MDTALIIAGSLAALIIGLALGYVFRIQQAKAKLQSVEALTQKMMDDARRESETLKKEALLQAKDQLYQMKLDFEADTKERKHELTQWEKRLAQKEDSQERKLQNIENREREATGREQSLKDRERNIDKRRKEYDELVEQQKAVLEQTANLTQQEAKDKLIEAIESEARHEAAKTVRVIETEAQETASKKAQKILALACQRYAGDYAQEKTVSVVSLPSDEMKGRIIGREGRNIRAIEAATGVDLIIDDTPEAVILSGFNPMRREVARLSLDRLISDGRIHPARIEEVVKKATTEVEASVKEAGEQATFDVGVHGIHPEVIKLLGTAEIPLLLCPERAAALFGGRLLVRHHGQ
jgi:ribonuclease Y